MVKVPYYYDCGLTVNNGNIQVYSQDSAQIESLIANRETKSIPIVPATLNYAVKAALTDASHLTMTSAEQATAQSVLGISGGGGDTSALSSAIDAISGILSGYTDQKLIFTLQDNSTITATFFVKDIISGAAPSTDPSELYVTVAGGDYPPALAASGTYSYVSGSISDNTALYQLGSSSYYIIYSSSNSRWEIADIPEVFPSSLYFYGSSITGSYTGFNSYYGTATVSETSGRVGEGGGGGGGTGYVVSNSNYAASDGTYTDNGTTLNNRPVYTNGSYYMFFIVALDISDGNGWVIDTNTAQYGEDGIYDYPMHSENTSSETPPTTGWTNATVTQG